MDIAEMIQSVNYENFHLEYLQSILKDKKFATVDAFSIYLEVTDQKQFNIDPRIEQLWDKLLKWIPAGAIIVKERSVAFTQQLSLPQWLEPLRDSFGDIFVRQSDNISLLPDFHNLKVWVEQREPVYGVNNKENVYDPYWWYLFRRLELWSQVVQAKLHNIHWELRETTIDFIMRWKGAFEDIEHCEIPDFQRYMWKIKYRDVSSWRLSVVSNASILRVQLLALIGGNKLHLIEVKDNMLKMDLQITRADKVSASGQILSEETVDVINKYINSQIIPGYLNTSKQLEDILVGEIDRLNSYVVSQGADMEWIIKYQENTLNELILIRRHIEKLVD